MSPANSLSRVPSLAVDVAADGVRLPLSRTRVAEVAREVLRGEGVKDALLSIAFVTKARIAAMNREHLGHRGATDVISFGFQRASKDTPVVGDVYICPDVARERAAELGAGVREEITRLVVHGTLHILGHEHPEDGDRESSPMWQKQEGILRRLATESGATRPRKRASATKKQARKAAVATRKAATKVSTKKAAAKRTTAKTTTTAKKAAMGKKAATAKKAAKRSAATRKPPAPSTRTRSR